MTVEELKNIRKEFAYSISSIESIIDRMAYSGKKLTSKEEREYKELVNQSEKNAKLIERIDKIIESKQKINKR